MLIIITKINDLFMLQVPNVDTNEEKEDVEDVVEKITTDHDIMNLNMNTNPAAVITHQNLFPKILNMIGLRVRLEPLNIPAHF